MKSVSSCNNSSSFSANLDFSSESDESEWELGKKSTCKSKSKKCDKRSPSKSLEQESSFCLICGGNENKGKNNLNSGKNIDFRERFLESAFHYSLCYYNTRKFFEYVSPGETSWKDDKPIDSSGEELIYSCGLCPSGKKKNMSFRAYFIHQAVRHEKLEKFMMNDHKHSGIQRVLENYREGRAKTCGVKIYKCHMDSCSFSSTRVKLEMQKHCVMEHFKSYFVESRNNNGKPRIPDFDSEKGIKCGLRKKTGKSVRIKGERDDVVLHYAIEHDKLLSALEKQALFFC